MSKKLMGIRLEPKTISKLDAWSLLLKMDKTQIIEESFDQWESNRSDEERKSVNRIVDELQKHGK